MSNYQKPNTTINAKTNTNQSINNKNNTANADRKQSGKGRLSIARNSLVYKQVLLEQQFKLPENFQMKILCLEEDLENKKITGDQLVELINLYSVRKF